MGDCFSSGGGGEGSSGVSKEDAKKLVDDEIAGNKVVVFSKSYCPHCKKAKAALDSIGVEYKVIELDGRGDCDTIQDYLNQLTGARTVPRVFIDGKCIGGGSETVALKNSGELQKMIASTNPLPTKVEGAEEEGGGGGGGLHHD
ncbi:hypothetical protein FOL47_001666 [Perkinsus chesapeaki]|uniref:Glutaredoxin domain-containing protein n=1 Tax=Perkinsus chesapeaki TaxID=330153 RepID=A0A7J6MJ68_PERCH|nr:hypothetical protein FOL47_001666 [Perkinsus chesapeaki]